MAVVLYLVRHGQTVFNREHRMQGSCDSRLTKLGVRQLETLHDYFDKRNIEFDKAYCSTQERASDSLEILTDQDYERIKELKEKDYGFFEGRQTFLWPLHHLISFKPEVEDNRDVVARMERGMNLILRDAQDGETILVVGHGESMSQYIRNILGERQFRGFQNASFVKLEGDGQMMRYVESEWPAKFVHLNIDEAVDDKEEKGSDF